MRVRKPRFKQGKIILAVGLLITIGGMLGSAAFDMVQELAKGNSGALKDAGLSFAFWGVLLAVFGLVLLWARKVVVDIIDSEARVTAVAQEAGRKVLVMGLSYIRDEEVLGKMLKSAQTYKPEIMALPVKKFEAYVARKDEFPDLFGGAWQQNVRTIHEHSRTLEKIIVLPSEASVSQFNHFRKYIQSLFGPDLRVEYATDNKDSSSPFALYHGEKVFRDYNDYNYVYRGLERALEQAGLKTDLGPDDISIDITSGTAIFSIAGAVLTLNGRIKFVYVTTDGFVLNYDAQIDLLGAAAL